MNAARHSTVDLSPDAARLATDAVTSGEFPDANAAVEAAVLGWNAQRDALMGYTMEELRRLGDAPLLPLREKVARRSRDG